MNQAEFQASYKQMLLAWIERLRQATDGVAPQDITGRPNPKEWSVAQIAAHTCIAAEAYLAAMKAPLKAPARSANPPAKTSWIGRLIAKMAGPQSTAPAPPSMAPPEDAGLEALDRFCATHSEVVEFLDACGNVDLAQAKFRNPFLPFITLRFTDALIIMEAHAERHVKQVEERLRHKPKTDR